MNRVAYIDIIRDSVTFVPTNGDTGTFTYRVSSSNPLIPVSSLRPSDLVGLAVSFSANNSFKDYYLEIINESQVQELFTNGDTSSISQYNFDPQTGTVTIENYYFVWREYYTFSCYYYASNSHTARVTIIKNGVHYGYVVADNPNMFPADGVKNGCWYELIGAVNMASNGILNSKVNEIKDDAVLEIMKGVKEDGQV